MKKNATIYDVAAHCGLSVASVSRVLAKADYPVTEATRQKVLKSARELNYTVNTMAKMLKQQSTREIGVIVPNISNPCYAALVQGIQAVAIRNDYHVLLYNSFRNSETEQRNISMMLEKRVDGILLVSIGGNTDILERVNRMNCKLITVEQQLPGCELHVGYDYEKAGELATKNLIEFGHRDIAFLGARLDRPSRVQMLNGYKKALLDEGIEENPEYIWLADAEAEQGSIFEIENGRTAARHMLTLDQRPTGCVCLNDMTALGAVEAIRDAGLSVPEDMSVIGFDNISYSALSTPKLTTIDQHAGRMGELAMQMMIEQLTGLNPAQTAIELEPDLIERASVSFPRI